MTWHPPRTSPSPLSACSSLGAMGGKAEQPASPGGAAKTSGDLPRVATFTRGDLATAGGTGGDSNNGSFGASSMEGTFAGEVRGEQAAHGV